MSVKRPEYVQTFGRKKNALAVALCKSGKGVMRVNGVPVDIVEPAVFRRKVLEPWSILGPEKFQKLDVRVRVRGGGYTSQVYAIRMAIARAVVAFYQKYVDEQAKREVKEALSQYDRGLLVMDTRRCEPKHFGGRGARARRTKAYR
jgi:small subunit ribosomal protein S16e